MKLATTTEDFLRFYVDDDKARLAELAKSGFRYIDLSFFHYETDKYLGDDWKTKVKELKSKADDLGVEFVQMHALIDVGYNGVMTFESSSILGLPSKRRPFEKDNRLTIAPIEVYRASEKLLYEIGKSILTKYNMFEE